jgi:hypothetical protein
MVYASLPFHGSKVSVEEIKQSLRLVNAGAAPDCGGLMHVGVTAKLHKDAKTLNSSTIRF